MKEAAREQGIWCSYQMKTRCCYLSQPSHRLSLPCQRGMGGWQNKTRADQSVSSKCFALLTLSTNLQLNFTQPETGSWPRTVHRKVLTLHTYQSFLDSTSNIISKTESLPDGAPLRTGHRGTNVAVRLALTKAVCILLS